MGNCSKFPKRPTKFQISLSKIMATRRKWTDWWNIYSAGLQEGSFSQLKTSYERDRRTQNRESSQRAKEIFLLKTNGQEKELLAQGVRNNPHSRQRARARKRDF